jgi:hypothetical protein
MRETNNPAGSGKKIRALLVSALFLSIVAGAFVIPAMANPMYELCMSECFAKHPQGPPDPSGSEMWKCQVECAPFYFTNIDPPVIPGSLPPCCTYGPLGEPYCQGLGKCLMNPVVGTTS